MPGEPGGHIATDQRRRWTFGYLAPMQPTDDGSWNAQFGPIWYYFASGALAAIFAGAMVDGLRGGIAMAVCCAVVAAVRSRRLSAVFEPGAVSVRTWAKTEYYRADQWAITERRGSRSVIYLMLRNGTETVQNFVLAAGGIYRWDRSKSRIEQLFSAARTAGFEVSREPDEWREFIERNSA